MNGYKICVKINEQIGYLQRDKIAFNDYGITDDVLYATIFTDDEINKLDYNIIKKELVLDDKKLYYLFSPLKNKWFSERKQGVLGRGRYYFENKSDCQVFSGRYGSSRILCNRYHLIPIEK